MQRFEYRVVSLDGALTRRVDEAEWLEELINAEAAEGWEFQRIETLEMPRKRFMRGVVHELSSLVVFRRPVEPARETVTPLVLGVQDSAPEAGDVPDESDPQFASTRRPTIEGAVRGVRSAERLAANQKMADASGKSVLRAVRAGQTPGR